MCASVLRDRAAARGRGGGPNLPGAGEPDAGRVGKNPFFLTEPSGFFLGFFEFFCFFLFFFEFFCFLMVFLFLYLPRRESF